MKLRLLALLISIVFLAGCSVTLQTEHHRYYHPYYDGYETWGWGPAIIIE